MKRAVRGFTLIELLMVVVVLGILASIMLPAIHQAKEMARQKQAMADQKTISGAIQLYRHEYGEWPVPGGDHGKPDQRYTDNKDIVNCMTNRSSNSKEIVIIEPNQYRRDANGNLVDAWGDKYIITIDTDYDNSLPDGVVVDSPNI